MFILGRSTPYAPGVLNPGIMLKGPSHHRGISYAELPPNEPTTHGSPPIPFHRPPTRLGQPSLQLSHISVRSSSPKVQTRLDLPVSTQTTTGHAEYRLQGKCRSSTALGSVRSVRFHLLPPILEDTGCPIPPLRSGRSKNPDYRKERRSPQTLTHKKEVVDLSPKQRLPRLDNKPAAG